VAAGKELANLEGDDYPVCSLAFSPDSRVLAVGYRDQRVRLWDLSTGQPTAVLRGETEWPQCLSFSPDGKLLAVGGGLPYSRIRGLLHCEVTLWDVATRQRRPPLAGHTNEVYAVAFSPNGKLLASGGFDKSLRLWDVPAAKQLQIVRDEKPVTHLSFAPDGKLLASVRGVDVRLWDVASWKEVAKFSEPEVVGAVAFAPDGREVVVANVWGKAARRNLSELLKGAKRE
jgi:WD40 repeat protein